MITSDSESFLVARSLNDNAFCLHHVRDSAFVLQLHQLCQRVQFALVRDHCRFVEARVCWADSAIPRRTGRSPRALRKRSICQRHRGSTLDDSEVLPKNGCCSCPRRSCRQRQHSRCRGRSTTDSRKAHNTSYLQSNLSCSKCTANTTATCRVALIVVVHLVHSSPSSRPWGPTLNGP
jgi:hypothetical protein